MRVSAARMRRRIAGRLGLGGGPGSEGVPALFPPEPQVLQEGKGELAEKRVVVQAAPGPPREVVEPQLVFELLVHLLADPPRLDQGGQGLEGGIGREIGQVVLPFAGSAMLGDEPRLVTRQVLRPRRDRPVGHPHPKSGEFGLEPALGAIPPRDGAAGFRARLDQLGGTHARDRGHGMLTRPAGWLACGVSEHHPRWVDLLRRQDPDHKSQLPFVEPGTELGGFAVLDIGQHAREAGPEASTRSTSSRAICHFGR
jgi:hypothetical protein